MATPPRTIRTIAHTGNPPGSSGSTGGTTVGSGVAVGATVGTSVAVGQGVRVAVGAGVGVGIAVADGLGGGVATTTATIQSPLIDEGCQQADDRRWRRPAIYCDSTAPHGTY